MGFLGGEDRREATFFERQHVDAARLGIYTRGVAYNVDEPVEGMILDHIARAREMGLAYVYLGYWVEGSRKMGYKGRFLPQERLTPHGWTRVER